MPRENEIAKALNRRFEKLEQVYYSSEFHNAVDSLKKRFKIDVDKLREHTDRVYESYYEEGEEFDNAKPNFGKPLTRFSEMCEYLWNMGAIDKLGFIGLTEGFVAVDNSSILGSELIRIGQNLAKKGLYIDSS